MKITVLYNYGGSLTGELRILPGEYDSEDAALFGLADYLVENGHAAVVGDVKEVKVGEGRELIMSEDQWQGIKDITSEAITAMDMGVDMAQGDDVTVVTEVPAPKDDPPEDKPKRKRGKQ